MASNIYALCKTKCNENLGRGKLLNGSTGQDVAKWKLSFSMHGHMYTFASQNKHMTE